MFKEFQETAREIYNHAKEENRIILNPSNRELKKLTSKEPEARRTKYGNIMVETEPTSRAAMFTKNNLDCKFGKEEQKLLKLAKDQLSKEKLVSIDVQIGDGSEGITARLIVPTRFAHVAYGGRKLFKSVKNPVKDPTYQIIMFSDREFEKNKTKKLPKKSITIRNAHSQRGKLIKIIRNSNYLGEWKKGVFTGEDYRAKQTNSIFLHAGCRQDYLKMPNGKYKLQSSLFIALSANGKTSLTCKVLARKKKEKSWLIQDDGGILKQDGSFKGFEAGGIFVKTDSLNPKEQKETYLGVLNSESYLENVYVDKNGEIDFYNVKRTSNGRAVIQRKNLLSASKEINVRQIDNLFIITRGNIIPAIAKLTQEQATAFMILGQSMESSAGDPTQAGKIKNIFFYDPFIAGSKKRHINIFYKIIKKNPQIRCYLINTGGIGEGKNYIDIKLKDTIKILRSVLREEIIWEKSKETSLLIPKKIKNVSRILFHPEELYDIRKFKDKQKKLDLQRINELKKYQGIPKKILNVFLMN